MKQFFKIALIILLVIIFYSYTADSSNVNSTIKLFRNTGGETIGVEINGSCEINTTQAPENMAVGLFNAAKMGDTYSIKNYNEKTELVFEWKEYNGRIFTSKVSGKNTLYASFTLSQQCNIENINIIRRYVSKAFSEFEAEPSFSTLIRGKFNECLNLKDMEKIAAASISKSRGKVEDMYKTNNMVSICGYIPGIDERLKYKNSYINMNMALRYSESDGCTYIWLGSPVIYDEY